MKKEVKIFFALAVTILAIITVAILLYGSNSNDSLIYGNVVDKYYWWQNNCDPIFYLRMDDGRVIEVTPQVYNKSSIGMYIQYFNR